METLTQTHSFIPQKCFCLSRAQRLSLGTFCSSRMSSSAPVPQRSWGGKDFFMACLYMIQKAGSLIRVHYCQRFCTTGALHWWINPFPVMPEQKKWKSFLLTLVKYLCVPAQVWETTADLALERASGKCVYFAAPWGKARVTLLGGALLQSQDESKKGSKEDP